MSASHFDGQTPAAGERGWPEAPADQRRVRISRRAVRRFPGRRFTTSGVSQRLSPSRPGHQGDGVLGRPACVTWHKCTRRPGLKRARPRQERRVRRGSGMSIPAPGTTVVIRVVKVRSAEVTAGLNRGFGPDGSDPRAIATGRLRFLVAPCCGRGGTLCHRGR